MEKDFDRWNEKKKALNFRSKDVYFHEREIWWCALGINVGHEEDGKRPNFLRPAIIMKKYNKDLMIIVPTSRKFKNNIFRYKIMFKNRKSYVLINQIRVIDSKRLIRRITELDSEQFLALREKVMKSL